MCSRLFVGLETANGPQPAPKGTAKGPQPKLGSGPSSPVKSSELV